MKNNGTCLFITARAISILLGFGVCFVILGVFVACAAGQQGKPPTIVGPFLRVELDEGPSYKTQHTFFLTQSTVLPQTVVWLERNDGAYVETLAVTYKDAKKAYFSAASRPEALPIWRHRNPESSQIDAVTRATPPSSWTIETSLTALAPGHYVLFVETNSSYDYPSKADEEKAKSTGDVNGQPSVLWRGYFEWEGALNDSTKVPAITFEPLATGSQQGRDGKLYPLTNAGSAVGKYARITASIVQHE